MTEPAKPIPAAQEILFDLGFTESQLTLECQEACRQRGWHPVDAIARACEHLWRVGLSGIEADAIADWYQARMWLSIASYQCHGTHSLNGLPFDLLIDAIAKIDVNLG